jgi:DNA-binding IclR family transcriptional regulator
MPGATLQPSTRRLTRETGVFIRETPPIRSLDRGLAILRAFRPGIGGLGNAEIAQRTGLPRATVSRLTRTLVDAGFLVFDLRAGVYRLGPPFLGFAQSVREASIVLQTALPLMREVAEGLRINVGLAVVDAGEMIYLDSVRKSRLGLFRHVQPGSRLPIAETALGRAWLAGLPAAARTAALSQLAPRYGERWPSLAREISRSVSLVERHGYCAVSWQVGLVSIATPLVLPGHPVHAFNISYPAPAEAAGSAPPERRYASLLLRTAARVREALGADPGEAGAGPR